MRYEWTIPAGDQGKTLLEFLHSSFQEKNYSLKKVKGFIDAGYCFVNGRPERFYRSRPPVRAKITLSLPAMPAKKNLDILLEDDVLIAFNKPAGISVDERLLADVAKMGKTIYLVHRLDKQTTGILLCAKTEMYQKALMNQFRERTVHKRYLAIVDNQLEQDDGVIENYLGPIGRFGGSVKWGVVEQGGLFARTDWSCKKRVKSASLVELRPQTGRTHQLRVHMASINHPIIGDFYYAQRFNYSYDASRQLLHAGFISFCHPETQRKIQLKAPLPEDMSIAVRSIFGEDACGF
ncbi:MAG: RluA family pseudouridine synthase [Verrucomicrobia bacterium]|nr:RluA family pseudouridine synthase [Verrucomicrobiota bacterium]